MISTGCWTMRSSGCCSGSRPPRSVTIAPLGASRLPRRTRSGATPRWREPTPTRPVASWSRTFETCLRMPVTHAIPRPRARLPGAQGRRHPRGRAWPGARADQQGLSGPGRAAALPRPHLRPRGRAGEGTRPAGAPAQDSTTSRPAGSGSTPPSPRSGATRASSGWRTDRDHRVARAPPGMLAGR